MVRGSFAAVGLGFAILVGLSASSLESWLLTTELVIMASAIWLSPRIGRGVALHIVSGSFLVYQTIVLDVTRATPNLGVVWFLLVPTWATLWGRARHLLLWVPATAVAVGWTAMRADPSDAMWQHPLTVPNLFAVLGLSAVLALAFHRERRRRERALQRAMSRLQAETRDRKAAEAQARTDRAARHRLLAMLSHELRSPMTSLALTADMLDADESVGQSVGQLQRTARATLRTLDDILDLVRLEDGVLPQRRERFSVTELLDDAIEVISPQLDGSRVELLVDVESGTPDRFAGDRARLRQVLLNLLGNALKHTRVGQIRVHVRRDAEHAGLFFCIEDTGVGIAASVIRDVFEPWQQGDEAPLGGGGVGLGLSISRDFVEAMGGTIWVERTGPDGTQLCFRVGVEQLPGPNVCRGAKAYESRLARAKPTFRRPRELRGQRVLVVDDDSSVRDVVAQVFEHAGASVMTAADGREAESKLGIHAFDLVVLDLEMPGRTGLDVIASMSAHDAPPVLVLSGSLNAEGSALEAGADAFIVKPVRTGQLLDVAVELTLGQERSEPTAG